MEIVIKSAAELLDEFLKVRSESEEPLEIDNEEINELLQKMQQLNQTK